MTMKHILTVLIAALLQQADGGNAEAQYELAERYKRGVGGAEKNGARAAHYYELSAGQDYPQAMFGLGMCYLTGFGKERDFEQGIMWVRRAANRGVVDAMLILGSCYEEGGFGLPKDGRQAAYWYGKAAEQGNADGQNSLGRWYIMGTGVEKDTVMAVEYYRKSAEQGYAIAQYNLGGCYEKGAGVAKDLVKAVEWIRKSAEQGYAPAQYSLGLCYENGIVVEKNLAQAIEWYRKAAEQGHAEAQYALGRCLENGTGVETDLAQAVAWYEMAAEQGYAEAQYRFGLCLENGTGVEKKDLTRALDLYDKAAKQGFAAAQYRLGRCYENGTGLTKNLNKALEWYRKAAAQGYPGAAEALARVESALAKPQSGGSSSGGGGFSKNYFDDLIIRAKLGIHVAEAELGYIYYNEGDYEQAVYWLEMAAPFNLDAAFFLGLCYYHGYGVEVDYSRAVGLLRRVADSYSYDNKDNIISARYLMAICCDDGLGMPENNVMAFHYYLSVAEDGYEPAYGIVGAMYYNGTGVARNYAEAIRWFELAAAQGDITSKYNLGLCYYFGHGINNSTKSIREKNYAIASRLFEEVVKDGKGIDIYYNALSMLGQCYLFGRGKVQDSSKAFWCFHDAGLNDEKNAQYYLGMFYYTGRDNVVTVDYHIAVEWFTKSANQGVAAAQYELGRCCLYGVGTTKNRENAKVLLEAAAKAGDKNAKKLYEEEFLNKVQEL